MKNIIVAALAASVFGLAAHAQVNNLPSDKLKTSNTIPPAIRNVPDLKIQVPPAPQPTPVNGNTYGVFYCRGQAKKWRVQKITSGPKAGQYSMLAWFELGDSTIRNGCYWDERHPATTDGRDSNSQKLITFELVGNIAENFFEMVTFQGETPTEIELDLRSLERNRNMNKLWLLSAKGVDQRVRAVRTNRGAHLDFGVIYEVYNVDIEHGYRFPADITSAPLQ